MRNDEPRHSPARDRQIIQSITEFAIVVTDREGVVTDWNAGAEHILGWSAHEMVGRTVELFFTPEDRESGCALKEMAIALETGRALDERWHLKRDGSRFWASGEMMPLLDDDDQQVGFVKVLRDRTDQTVAQRARQDDEEQLEAIFSQAPSFMALLRGPEHRFERVNPGYSKLVGGRDVVGRTVAEALPEAAAQGFVDLLDDVYRRGQAHHATETPITLQAGPHANAEHLFLDFVYQPIHDADGSVVGIFVEGIDVTERIAGARRLRETEDRYRALAENVDVGMCVVEMKFDRNGKAIDYRIVDGNPAYERQTGLYGSVGKWVSEVAPGLERHWFDMYGNVALTGEPARFELGAAGLGNRMFEVEAHRVGEPDRHHVAILFTDVTDRRRAVTDLADSERKWRSLFESLQEGFILGKVIRDEEGRVTDWRYEEVNQAWGDLVGIPQGSAAGRTIREVFPGIEDEWVAEFADVVETGEPVRFTRQVGSLDRWYDGVCQPVGGDRFTVIFIEVTNRIAHERRQTALLGLGDLFRDARTASDITSAAARCLSDGLLVDRVGFGSVDETSETIDIQADWCAPGLDSIAGRHHFRSFGSFIDELKSGRTIDIPDVAIAPQTADYVDAFAAIQIRGLLNLPIMEHGRLVLIVFAHSQMPRTWTSDELQFVRQVGDRAQAALARIRAEEMQGVLNGELSHRLKNSFAMVQAVASQTLKGVTEREAVEALNQRLRALSHAHDVLMQQSWSVASLRDVATAVLHVFEMGDRFELKGRDLEIGPRATLSLSLLLHELATNAVKYGALSVPEGHVEIEWVTRRTEGEDEFCMTWRERGGPPPTQPSGRGFGSRIIRMGLIGTGGADLSYEPEGFEATMCASLSQMQQA